MPGTCRAGCCGRCGSGLRLLGVSVLTTYQHHFIDIPTGALLGFLCLWLWPDSSTEPVGSDFAGPTSAGGCVLAARYAVAAAALAIAGIALGGAALWLLWPAVSLALVAANYAVFGAGGFQKGPDGRMSLAALALLPALSARRLDQFAPVDPPRR